MVDTASTLELKKSRSKVSCFEWWMEPTAATGIELTKLMTMTERDFHLAQADRHIAETKQLIARQRELVAALSLIKQPTEAAVSMLEALQKSLDAFECHRQLLLELFSPRRRSGIPTLPRPLSGSKQPSDTITSPGIAAE